MRAGGAAVYLTPVTFFIVLLPLLNFLTMLLFSRLVY
jgi:hypothetical protein